MREILTLISAAALLATPAISQARGFDSDFSQSITGPIKLEVIVSEDLAHRANNLPKKRSDRGSRSHLNAAFSNNGYYGDKEIVYLLEDMQKELRQDFAKRGIALSDTAPTILRVTIEKVRPNRPTFKQLSVDSSLSFRSISTGGAHAEYEYYSSFNDRATQFARVWGDTSHAFSNFSRKLSKKLAAEGAASS